MVSKGCRKTARFEVSILKWSSDILLKLSPAYGGLFDVNEGIGYVDSLNEFVPPIHSCISSTEIDVFKVIERPRRF